MTSSNARRSGVDSRVVSLPLEWGHTSELGPVAEAMAEGGRCSPLIVAADVLTDRSEAAADALEASVRRLLALGGCRAVLLCWKTRNFREELFLRRLVDLGTVHVLSRSVGDPPPPETASEEEADAWKGRNQGSVVVAALRVGGRASSGGFPAPPAAAARAPAAAWALCLWGRAPQPGRGSGPKW
eukprot:4682614-Prymnesium_polylepis.1